MMRTIFQRIHARGQAIVEFALAATLIFMLLGAAIDLGFIFFTVQGIHNAAQEGATYGSRWLATQNNVWQINIPEIQKRVRTESGASASNGIVNLLDLDNNGVDDSAQGTTVINPNGTTGYIKVVPLEDTNRDGNPTNDNNKRCDTPAAAVNPCYVLVTVSKVYNVFFPVVPSFAKQFTLSSSYYMLIRNSFAEAGAGSQSFPTPEPTRGASNIVVKIINDAAAQPLTDRSQTDFEVTAWDTAYGTTNGAGIASVTITIRETTGTGFILSSGPYSQPRFCAYPKTTGCGTVADVSTYPSGSYTITAVVKSKSGTTATQTSSFTRP